MIGCSRAELLIGMTVRWEPPEGKPWRVIALERPLHFCYRNSAAGVLAPSSMRLVPSFWYGSV